MSILQLLFGFQGRIRRSQWWLVTVVMLLVTVTAFVFLGFVMQAINGGVSGDLPQDQATTLGWVVLVCYALLVWVQLAIAVKRYHDRDHTGFWILITLIPLGQIWAFIELGFLDGTQGPNRFGPSPKGIGGTDLARVFS